MIGVFTETGFFARKFLEMTFSGLSAFLLQGSTQVQHALACLLYLLTIECFACTVSGYVDNAQINAEGISWLIRRWGRNVKSHRQIENTVAIEEIGMSLDSTQTGLLIASHQKWNQDTARKGQEGHMRQALKGHHTRVIDDSPLWSKCGLNALVTFVGFTGFTDASNSQLSSKPVRATQLTIHQLLQFKLICGLFGKSHLSYIVSRFVKGVHGFKQSLVLFSCRSQFQEHRLFHTRSIASLTTIVNRQGLKPQSPDPMHECRGFRRAKARLVNIINLPPV